MMNNHRDWLSVVTTAASWSIALILIATSNTSSNRFVLATVSASTAPPSIATLEARYHTNKKPILLLDVDNTLYDDRLYMIEQHIISSIHEFVMNHVDYEILFPNDILTSSITSNETQSSFTKKYEHAKIVSNRLHHQYGSTIDGLVHLLRLQHDDEAKKSNCSNNYDANHVKTKVTQMQKKFYNTVYHPNNIDYSRLLLTPNNHQRTIISTGYGHQSSMIQNQKIATLQENRSTLPIRQLLKSTSKICHIQLASNSPIRHVQTIVQAMGLCSLFTSRNMNNCVVYTPDTLLFDDDNNKMSDNRQVFYPTKLQPLDFFQNAQFRCASNQQDHASSVTMIDDSLRICQAIEQSLPMIDMIHLSYNSSGVPSLLHAICAAMGWIQQRRSVTPQRPQESAVGTSSQQLQSSDLADDEPYHFDDVLYLQHKNVVDLHSIHRPTYHRMVDELVNVSSIHNNINGTITIVDVGAGILFMLKTLLNDDSNLSGDNIDDRLPSFVHKLRHHYEIHPDDASTVPKHIDYYAYEPNDALYDACHQQLIDLDFVLLTDEYIQPSHAEATVDDTGNNPIRVLIYEKSIVVSSSATVARTTITVHLCFCDFRSISTSNQQSTSVSSGADNHRNSHAIPGRCTPINCPNVVIGCCFADLFDDPNRLIASLLRCFGMPSNNEILRTPNHDTTSSSSTGFREDNENRIEHLFLYFPITFTGTTSVFPPQPFETVEYKDGLQQNIPSDTLAFNYYAKALIDIHNHNLDHHSITESVENYGGSCFGHGISNWVIHPTTNKYLWQTMMYFFGTVAAPIIQNHGWYARGWIQRMVRRKPIIRANNVDLLFRVPLLGTWKLPKQHRQQHEVARIEPQGSNTTTYDEILFTSPYKVTSVKKPVEVELQPNHVRIQSECSLISSGTELKIFEGNFDSDALLDTTIQDFNQATMSYPLSYGYSLIGRIVECGHAVEDAATLLGRRVFTFSAHASQVTTDRSNVHIVPNDIDALDAIFMPSVETALSLVQEAHPIFGENIAIYGQGLIGLLITAVLYTHRSSGIVETSRGKFGTITTFDTIADRLSVSSRMGASQALVPTPNVGPFDVVIEVSGNRQALQMAIDTTRHGGRVIIGSWYGPNEISLKLGIDFHRSHKSIKASQVSEIPEGLSKTWTKERRFALTWALIAQIRPSRLLTLRTTLDNAQSVYAALGNGTEIAVAFQYNEPPLTQ